MNRITCDFEILMTKCMKHLKNWQHVLNKLFVERYKIAHTLAYTDIQYTHSSTEAYTHTRSMLPVLDSCHIHSDFWLGLPWVTCPPAELCGGVQPVYRGLCEGWGGLGYCTLSLH